jgi:hypothetical protein
MNKFVPASVLRIVRNSDEHKSVFDGKKVSALTSAISSNEEPDPMVILHRNFLKHMALCSAYAELPDTPENIEFDSDAEADAAENFRRASFYIQPSTIIGILAALEWFREDFEQSHIEQNPNPDWADCWGLKMLEGSIGALRQMSTKEAA